MRVKDKMTRVGVWNRILLNAEKEGQIAAALLAKLADRMGMTPQGVSVHEDLLDQGDLDPADVTPSTIAYANLLAHKWNKQLAIRVRRLNKGLDKPFEFL